MIKISDFKIIEGLEFSIRNTWRKDIVKQLNKPVEKFPFHFKVVSTIFNKDKVSHYICESIPSDKNETIIQIAVTDTILNYVLGLEVPDCNVGLYFNDYLPIENSYLILSSYKNINTVTPVRFQLKINIIEYNKKELPFINLVLVDLITEECYTINKKIKDSWKHIIYGNLIEESFYNYKDNKIILDKIMNDINIYMTDMEKMYQDTFVHKTLVNYACLKMAEYLKLQNLESDANELIQRGKLHDNSKITNKDEFRALTGIINDKSCLRNPNLKLSQYKQDSIELHWNNNTHHPEHYTKFEDMSRLDRMEFVCDCFSRSIQYGTNLIEFMQTRQKDRFHFPELMFEEVLHLCKIIYN